MAATMDTPGPVVITEVGPRDGLQSLARSLPTGDKVAMIEALIAAGLRSIELTGFARSQVVPALADAEAVLAAVPARAGLDRRVLVPNMRGAQRAVAAGPDTLVALLTASESYSRRNQNRGVAELVEEAGRVVAVGRDAGLPVDAVIGISFFCPYEGHVPEDRVEWIVAQLVDHGVRSVCLGASVGMADPAHTYRLCRRLGERWPELPIALHLHDTNGMALANAVRGMDAGIRRFESAICGIGGGIAMPPGMAVGNVPTEDLLHLLDAMGVPSGLDLDEVLAAGRQVAALLGIAPRSHALRGGTRASIRARRGRQDPANSRTGPRSPSDLGRDGDGAT